MNNKDLPSCRTLNTFFSLIPQLVFMYGYFSGVEEFFSRLSTIFLSSHTLRSQEINKAFLQMFYYLISKNTCHRNNHVQGFR